MLCQVRWSKLPHERQVEDMATRERNGSASSKELNSNKSPAVLVGQKSSLSPIWIAGAGERKDNMATMTMDMFCQVRELKVAEEKVSRVNAGLTFSQKMNMAMQAGFSLFLLTGAFRSAVREQDEVISLLTRPDVQDLGPQEFASLAESIERLVVSNQTVIESARSVGFRPWAANLALMEDQAEHLASIAESFRMACDEEALEILAGMAREVQTGPTYNGCFDSTRERIEPVHA